MAASRNGPLRGTAGRNRTIDVGLVLLLLVLVLWTVFLARQGDNRSAKSTPPIIAEAGAQAPASQPEEGADPTEPDDAQQGPALRAPREIFHMLTQRRQALDEREAALESDKARLTALKENIQALLAQHAKSVKQAAAAQKKLAAAQGKRQDVREQRRVREQKRVQEREQAAQERIRQVAKIYEAMPPEEAAARIEKLPIKTALKVLQLLKSRAAGNILAQVNADKAAKLTERYLSQ